MTKEPKNKYLLPFNLILTASCGDLNALTLILHHYDGYIKKLATRYLTDDSGKKHTYLDSELYNRLKIRLITRTLAFNVK